MFPTSINQTNSESCEMVCAHDKNLQQLCSTIQLLTVSTQLSSKTSCCTVILYQRFRKVNEKNEAYVPQLLCSKCNDSYSSNEVS